jgi:pimeloyl-ACP methyl ester carboxylesterase
LFVSVGDVRLFVEVLGQEWVFDDEVLRHRPTIVALHGGPGVDGLGLRYGLAPLIDVAQLVIPDQRGCGRSDPASADSWSLGQWADDIYGLGVALGIERPIVLGLSFGGFVAQQYAITHPDAVSALILISSAARFPSPDEVVERMREVGGDAPAEAMRRHTERPTEETMAEVGRLCQPLYSWRSHTSPLFAALEGHFIRTPDVTRHWFAHAQRTLDLRADLASVKCPTLVLVGEHDPVNPPTLGNEIVAAITSGGARMNVVPDASHRVLQDNPDFVLQAIRRFITDLGG